MSPREALSLSRATRRRSLRAAFAAFGGLAAAVVACRKGSPDEIVYRGGGSGGRTVPTATASPLPEVVEPPPPAETFTKARLLQAIAACSIDRYAKFREAAVAYRAATASFAAAPTDDALRDAARAAYRSVLASWQETEVFRFGPTARSSEPGGKDLRDAIYAWPLFGRCTVDEQLVDRLYLDPNFGKTLISGRTLATADYIQFYGGTDHGCASGHKIVTSGSWAALGEAELRARKAAYASAIAADVVVRADALVAAWDPARGNFKRDFETAGAGSAVFPRDQDALNAVSHGLFYVELEVKDLKLARPLGFSDCASARCPEAVESRFGGLSAANLSANLKGFRRIFQGCADDGSGFGFDDWLRAVGAGELATKMIAAAAGIDVAIAALGDQALAEVISTEPAKAEALYAAVKVLTDSLKTEFVTILDLELPKTAEGDND